ncbi:hypothetical protein H1Q78_19890 [Cellulosimicrobium cellulans]|uniref:hypothetical protein n=1 Tax=Cellulosimicrobium cellulans TaxID=1710 RepID=UPI001EDAB965|nr:hypothetical protein [Cellulosimicrobium cellulans]UKJ63815.1 hypothetical protein H1Q78_19890 [Cellulosimicrobium cellulans]
MRTIGKRTLAVSALVAAAVAVAPSASAAPYDAGPCTFDVTRTGNLFTLDAGTCDWVLLEITASAYGANLSRSVSTTDVASVEIAGPVWAVSKALAVGRAGGVTGPVVRVL